MNTAPASRIAVSAFWLALLSTLSCGVASVTMDPPPKHPVVDAGPVAAVDSGTLVTPQTELCGNGIDDDGDGLVDEDCGCTAGTTRSCFSGNPALAGVGVCHAGQQSCSAQGELSTVWGPCSGEVLPGAEICNGIDDDCDGQVDEGITRACSSACGAGVEVCTNGAFGACSAPLPGTEICGNGIDDDCDGLIDENCFCIKSPGQTPWQMHLGEAPMCWGTTFPSNGDIGEYAFSTIPAASDPGWMPHAAPAISFDDPSAMCGVCNRRAGGDFTYFQTSFDIPVGFAVTSLTVNIANVDDGVRVTVFNAAHPTGAVNAGSYAFLGGGSTSNLASLVAAGSNRIVLTHVDDCCSERRIANATVSLNGSAINPCP